MPCSGASFSSCSLPAFPNPVLLVSTPMRERPIFFICWKIFTTAWLSFCGVLKTQRATGWTMTSAAAQERSKTPDSSASRLTAIVSPLVLGPMMAKTFCSSMSCFANETAFSGLAPVSFSTSCSLRPPTPPRAFRSSTSICSVRASGVPRNAAGPDTASKAPILRGSSARAPAGGAARATSESRTSLRAFIVISGGRGGVRPLRELSGREHPQAGGPERRDRLLGLLEPEDEHGVALVAPHDVVHVLDAHAGIAQHGQRVREAAGSVGHGHRDHLRLGGGIAGRLQHAARLLGVVDEQPQDAELGHVRDGGGADVDAGVGDHLDHLGEPA